MGRSARKLVLRPADVQAHVGGVWEFMYLHPQVEAGMAQLSPGILWSLYEAGMSGEGNLWAEPRVVPWVVTQAWLFWGLS